LEFLNEDPENRIVNLDARGAADRVPAQPAGLAKPRPAVSVAFPRAQVRDGGMIVYAIKLKPKAERFLKSQDDKTVGLVMEKLRALARDPFAPNNNVKKLVKQQGYRLRVGDIRVVYHIHKNILIILVINIGFRGEIYKEFQ